MRLDYFHIKGFRRIKEAKISCGDATFLIGENNIGKSSVLKAMEIFFSESAKLHNDDFFKIDETEYQVDEVVLEARFVALPEEAYHWRGFKGRIFKEPLGDEETNCIYYRKTYFRDNSNGKREMRTCNKTLGGQFNKCKTLQDLLDSGIDQGTITELYGDFDLNKNLVAKDKEKFEFIPELWELDENQVDWAPNPGGFEGVVSIKLPKFLLIPAENKKEEIEGKTGTLQETMKELFEDVRDTSDNYKQAQIYLDLLAKELDPNDEQKEFGKMLVDINKIIGGIFTNTKIHIDTNLSDASTSIKPSFDIEMSSNVRTKPERQGMGSIRSTVFALLRYRENFVQRKRQEGIELRPILIGFEEPEMYLHPNAAALMREKIYELATSSNSKIICTTHSPYMIDLSKRIDEAVFPKQVLNLLKVEHNDEINYEVCNSIPFNTTKAYLELQEDEKNFVKFILKIDDYVAKVFFCRKVIVVEGDTEDILFKETVERLPEKKRKDFLYNYQIIKARGKATIISLVKYFNALSIDCFVIHDRDTEDGATKFNEPILKALGNDESKRLMVENTIEDLLEYEEPLREKPYKMYHHIKETWGNTWEEIPDKWRKTFENNVAPELFK
ncbi:MAG: ATP-dependent endonuclease [Flavobacterium sp.]|nr:ATP-dependent endonuclease [Flavobacterium sp.]